MRPTQRQRSVRTISWYPAALRQHLGTMRFPHDASSNSSRRYPTHTQHDTSVPSGAEPRPNPVNIEVRGSVGDLREEWDPLVDDGGPASPFLKSWWVDNAASGKTIIVAVRTGDALVGGAAFEADRLGPERWGLTRIRSVGQEDLAPDHVDVVAAPGWRQRVVAEIARWLRSGNLVLDLDGLSAACELPWLYDAQIITSAPAPYMNLDRRDPLEVLPGRLRSTIKRSGRRLEKHGWHIERIDGESSAADASRALADLFRLHDSRWRDRSALGSERGPLESALTAGVAQGGVVVHQLNDGETVIASEVELLAGNRVSFYQAGRLTDREYRGSGSVLKAAVVRWAAESGFAEFDLLRGADPYKADWATHSRQVHRMRIGFGSVGAPAAAAMNLWKSQSPKVRSVAAHFRRSGTSEFVEDVEKHGSG